MLSAVQAAAEACGGDLLPLAEVFDDITDWLRDQEHLDAVDMAEAEQATRLLEETQARKEARYRQPPDTAPAQAAIAEAISRVQAQGDILADSTGQLLMAIARARREIGSFDSNGDRTQPQADELGYLRRTQRLITDRWLW